MAQRVEVPGMGVVEFPDGMSDAQIAAAIKRSIAQQPPPAPSPADNIGAMEAGLIAAGRTTDKVVQGVRQLYNKAVGDDATLAKMAESEAEKDRLYRPLQQARPIATAVGEAAPMLAVPVGGSGLVLKSAAAGALPGLLSYGSGEERLKNAAIGAAGGVVGAAGGKAVTKLIAPAGVEAGGISSSAVKAADRLGVNLSAGERTGNAAMQNFENYLARSPGSSGAMQARQAANTAAINKAAASSMGRSGTELTEDLFSTAKNEIGKEFTRLQGITTPQLGKDFFKALVDVDSANRARGSFANSQIDALVDKGLDLASKGKLSGTAYKEIRSELSSSAQQAFKSGDATLGQAYKAIRKALDDAAEASLSAADKKAWQTTREQYKAYKTLTASNVAEGGNVSPARLASRLRRDNPDTFRTGAQSGPLMDIARIGEAVKAPSNPNSGQLLQQMVYGNPLTGVPMVAGNKLAQVLYMSRPAQGYLSNNLLKLTPAQQLVIEKLAGPAGAPLAQNYLGAQ